nr:NTP transferase domain-containing protein [uncultured Actinotalea sp.]
MTGPGPRATVPAHDAVVLAGGRGRRLGGVSKPEVRVDGRPLLDRVLDATGSARRVVVVGPADLARPGVRTVLEDPPDGGPVAGLDAGLRALGDDPGAEYAGGAGDPDAADLPDAPAGHVLVLACDVPRAAELVPALQAAAVRAPDADVVWAVDAEGRGQPLLALYRRDALLAALARRHADGGVRNCSVRRLVAGLTAEPVPTPGDEAADVDTWQAVADLARTLRRRTPVTDETGAADAARTPRPDPAAGPVGGDELHRWVVHLVEALDVDPDAVDVVALLDLARDTAQGVARPAVPITAFLAGYAVAGRGADRAAFESVTQQVTALVAAWGEGNEVRP